MRRFLFAVLASFIAVTSSTAQTVITTAYAITTTTTGQCLGGSTKVTFDVTNNNTYTVWISNVGLAPAATGTHTLYYSDVSLSGPAGSPLGPPAWQVAGTATATSTTTTINNTFFSNLPVLIPPGATYRFCVEADIIRMIASSTPTTFTADNVTLGTTNTLWGCSGQLTGFNWHGSITCSKACLPQPTNLTATNITPSSADLSWDPIPGSDFEYVVTQQSGFPTISPFTTSTNTAKPTLLLPSTTYFVSVRKVCTVKEKSLWTQTNFTTLLACKEPMNIQFKNLSTTGVNITWDKWTTAQSYGFVVDQTPANPGATTVVNNATNAFAAITGLTEGTKYYVHLISYCTPYDTSAWTIDSFTTPAACSAPVVKIDHINTDQGVAYWEPVKTAVSYEYAITTSSTPPATAGTQYNFTRLHLPALTDGVDYYVHVRSNCLSQGVNSKSPWTTTSFKTFPTGINNISSGKGIACYPNPVTSQLTVELSEKPAANATLTITDIAGKVLRVMNIAGRKTTADMNGFAPGVYLLKYQDDAQTSQVKIQKL